MTINYSSTTTANQQYNFTGSISTFSDTTFALPDLAVTIGNAETITATIANVNGTDNDRFNRNCNSNKTSSC
jgi:hypothetical protein